MPFKTDPRHDHIRLKIGPSTTWLVVSRMKLRSSQGPNWDEASDMATMCHREQVPAMAIIEHLAPIAEVWTRSAK